jgi:imidazolonepropionase-like amidohydrolase
MINKVPNKCSFFVNLAKNYGNMKAKILLCLLFLPLLLLGQSPVPAKKQSGKPTLITGGTVHLGNGEVLVNAAVEFAEGVITKITREGVQLSQGDYAGIMDATDMHIYPGFVALNTSLGLVEIDAARATNDTREVGFMSPSVRSIIAYNTDSDLIPTVRNVGVLSAQIVPEGGRISGSSSMVQLDAWNWEDAAIATDEGMHVNWPNMSFGQAKVDGEESPEQKYQQSVLELERFFEEAKQYCGQPIPTEKLLKFEALRPLFQGKARLYVHTDKALSIRNAIQFTQKFGLSAAIVGGSESYLVADLLAQAKVAVVLGPTQALPDSDDHDYDQPYKTPAILQKAGVLFAITDQGSWRQRNLAYQAGQAVAFGLTKEEALRAITSAPAEIAGLSKRVGTLAVGHDATFFISEGDALDMRTNRVIAAFIQGRGISLDDKQKQLYERFKEKYD